MALERVPESGPVFEKTTMRTLRRLLNTGLVGPASPAPPSRDPPVSLYLCHPPQVRHLFFSFMASAASSLLVSPRPCPVFPRVPRGQLACSKGSSLLGFYLLYCSLEDPGSLGSVPGVYNPHLQLLSHLAPHLEQPLVTCPRMNLFDFQICQSLLGTFISVSAHNTKILLVSAWAY